DEEKGINRKTAMSWAENLNARGPIKVPYRNHVVIESPHSKSLKLESLPFVDLHNDNKNNRLLQISFSSYIFFNR
ncbi:unnamed protein product, partial [Sphenostylis stenocarpa]